MADHKIKFRLPEVSLGNRDAVFTVKSNGKKAGDLCISQGEVVWYPASARMGYAVSWEKLTKWMQENGKKDYHSY